MNFKKIVYFKKLFMKKKNYKKFYKKKNFPPLSQFGLHILRNFLKKLLKILKKNISEKMEV